MPFHNQFPTRLVVGTPDGQRVVIDTDADDVSTIEFYSDDPTEVTPARILSNTTGPLALWIQGVETAAVPEPAQVSLGAFAGESFLSLLGEQLQALAVDLQLSAEDIGLTATTELRLETPRLRIEGQAGGETSELLLNDVDLFPEDWTPDIGATTTDPGLGSGVTKLGGYRHWPKSPTGDAGWCEGTALVTVGTGPSAGSGNYRYTLPIEPHSTKARGLIGTWCLLDASTGAFHGGQLDRLGFGTTVSRCRARFPTGISSGSGLAYGESAAGAFPTTIGAGDVYSWTFAYPTAV